MDKLTYLEKLHDLAYQANLADVPDRREPWQQYQHASTHAQTLLNIVKSLLSPEEFDMFCDCFGDFDAFAANIANLEN